MSNDPLIALPENCVVGRFLRRHKRFSVAVQVHGQEVWIHSNNSGSMLGLVREGMPVLLSAASNPARKLPYTQEAVWLDIEPPRQQSGMLPCPSDPAYYDSVRNHGASGGFWVGVNTSIPNKLISAAFTAGLLPFAEGYTLLKREVTRGASRLDACLTATNASQCPPLWVECKNVTMVEDDVACFPDAATERGQKHLQELMDIVSKGERAAMFYLIQRADGSCFGPASVIDAAYAKLFWQAVDMGVEVYPYRAKVTSKGIYLGELLPLAKRCSDK